jgi:chitin synthase
MPFQNERIGSNSLLVVEGLEGLSEFVESAYNHLISEQEDQFILLLGERRSGKTQSFHRIEELLYEFTGLRNPVYHAANAVLALFGNSDRSEMFQYNQYQFTRDGAWVGTKFTVNLVNYSRYLRMGVFDIVKGIAAHSLPQRRTGIHSQAPEYLKLIHNFKLLGIDDWSRNNILNLLVTILHLQELEFIACRTDSVAQLKKNDENGACTVKNRTRLLSIAEVLEVDPNVLEATLTCKTIVENNIKSTKLLNEGEAKFQASELGKVLYANLFSLVLGFINSICSKDEAHYDHFIGVLDLPGLEAYSRFEEHEPLGFEEFLHNYTYEAFLDYSEYYYFQSGNQKLEEVGLRPVIVNREKRINMMDFFAGAQTGSLRLLNELTCESVCNVNDETFVKYLVSEHSGSNYFVPMLTPNFGLCHGSGLVAAYHVEDWSKKNADRLQIDFIALIRGSPDYSGSTNLFYRSLFSSKTMDVEYDVENPMAITAARTKKTFNRSVTPSVALTLARKIAPTSTLISQAQIAIEEILSDARSTKNWIIHHIRPCQLAQVRGRHDRIEVERQLEFHGILAIRNHPALCFSRILALEDAWLRFEKYLCHLHITNKIPKVAFDMLVSYFDWKPHEALVTNTHLLLSEKAWRITKRELDRLNDVNRLSNGRVTPESFVGTTTTLNDYTKESRSPPAKANKSILPKPISKNRKIWLCLTWSCTAWLPSGLLSRAGKMPRADRQLAWREKLALNFIILAINAMILFLIVGLGPLICSKSNQLSPFELMSKTQLDRGIFFMYGHYYQAPSIIENHRSQFRPNNAEDYWKSRVLGKDISQMFPKDVFWSNYCPGYQKPRSFRLFSESANIFVDQRWHNHSSSDLLPSLEVYKVGSVVWTVKLLRERISDRSNQLIVLYDRVYDISALYTPWMGNSTIFPPEVYQIFQSLNGRAGLDLGKEFDNLQSSNPQEWKKTLDCLNGMFLIGYIDHRGDMKCQIHGYILLAASIFLATVIGVKFLSSLQFGKKPFPELQQKYVLCFIPCYTEDETSLRNTIDSVAVVDYPDEKKVLFIVSDGMIVGSGNSLPTPRIVLNILGVDPNSDVPHFAYQAIGQGSKQLNHAQIYSGVYFIEGREVPYVVVVKIGQSSERIRPGNRYSQA